MMRHYRISLLQWTIIVAAGIFFSFSHGEASSAWKEVRGDHFIVYYSSSKDALLAQDVLRKSEEYYRIIGERVGYTRYSKFWTWDQRVNIFLFPDRESFLKQTGLPEWTNGYSTRDTQTFISRAIVTYRQERDFLNGVLPHEISHLVMHDYIATENLPLWFDEGVAQLEEEHKKDWAAAVVRSVYQDQKLIPLQALMTGDIRQERDPQIASLFYAQSLSVVDFLLKQYGQERFQRLCRGMRDQKTFAQALSHAYASQIDSVDDLERKWMDFISR